jgi:hypothetical protein
MGLPELSLQDDVASFRPERDTHGVGENVHPLLEPLPGFNIKHHRLGHGSSFDRI